MPSGMHTHMAAVPMVTVTMATVTMVIAIVMATGKVTLMRIIIMIAV